MSMSNEMVTSKIENDLDVLRRKFARVIEQRDDLRVKIALQEKPVTEGALAEILRAALRGEAGWGERARLALGDYKMIE